jgi:hypothetical protein
MLVTMVLTITVVYLTPPPKSISFRTLTGILVTDGIKRDGLTNEATNEV